MHIGTGLIAHEPHARLHRVAYGLKPRYLGMYVPIRHAFSRRWELQTLYGGYPTWTNKLDDPKSQRRSNAFNITTGDLVSKSSIAS